MAKLVLSLAVLLVSGSALAQSSASFPDLSQKPAPPTAAPPPAPAPAAPVESGFVVPAQYAPSFTMTPAPTFAPPMHDAPREEPTGTASTLTLVGAVMVGLPYATGLGIGASESFDNGSGWLAVPVGGPWLSLSGRRDPCAASEDKKEFDSDVGKCVAEPLIRGMLVLDGVLQASGAVLMIIGASSGGPKKPERTQVMAAPTPMGRDGYGMAVAGQF
ncbi:MAG: hypothetical protein IT377_28525 [Polyangiaceae bacterium]|nr:hypothetical protein [Polyangiaceae bacterium]